MTKVPMTVNGAAKLRRELAQLKAQRPIISKTIGEARELGDLRENAHVAAQRLAWHDPFNL